MTPSTNGQDDHLMTDLETIISSRAVMNQTFAMVEPGTTVIGLIVIPGAYKLSIIAAWVDGLTGIPVFTQYRDPLDPCYSSLLEIAPDPILLAARASIEQQVTDFLKSTATITDTITVRTPEKPKRKRPNKTK